MVGQVSIVSAVSPKMIVLQSILHCGQEAAVCSWSSQECIVSGWARDQALKSTYARQHIVLTIIPLSCFATLQFCSSLNDF